MLVLSRKKNESIVIDERIVITVVEIRGDKVRLGIEAPREVAIHRSEIFEALRRSQAGAVENASEVPAGDEP
jgi:carbon storage regulator